MIYKAFTGNKDIENDFYLNDFLNDDLKNNFRKTLGDAVCSNIRIHACIV